MTKVEFLAALARKLHGLPQEDVQLSLDYYGEMIDDRMEDGLSEAEAVADLGNMDELVREILLDTSLPKVVKARGRRSRALTVWEIILLVLGSPVWLPLLLAAIIVILAVYVVIWSIVVSLYAVDLAFAAAAFGGVAGLILFVRMGHVPQAILLLGCGLICGGLSILMFFGMNQVARLILKGSRGLLLGVKSWLFGKEDT